MTARRWGAPVAAAIGIALIVGLTVWLSGGTGSTHRLPVLHLRSAIDGSRPLAAAVAADRPPGPPTGGPYTLVGPLPQGQPSAAPVYHLPRATLDAAAAVARALHLGGAPVRAHGGWVLRTAGKRLAVRDDGSWSFGVDCFSGPTAQEELTVGCAYASAPASSYPAGPDESIARAAARDVMTALGRPDAEIVVNPGDPTAYAEGTPHVDGQLAYGWTTGIAVAADGAIDSGNGWVGTPTRGPAYPLVTAQRAFDLLQQQPRPMTDVCMVRKDGKPGCADMPPFQVTGASLGVAMDYESDRPILVPAWLFAVRGQRTPVVQVAVDPRFIG